MKETGSRKIVISQTGGPEALSLVVEPAPAPGEGEALVRIMAAGVAFADVMIRKGMYIPQPKLPVTPGYDFAGVVERTGPGVTKVKEGDKVASIPVTGSYAEHIVMGEERLAVLPDDMDFSDAAAMSLNYVSAYQMLTRIAAVRSGQTILVHGAGGGVGSAFLQLAGAMGVKAIGVASSTKKDLVESMGATHVDYTSTDFADEALRLSPGGVDAAFDAIGFDNFWKTVKTVKGGGVAVAYGMLSDVRKGKISMLNVAAGFTRMTLSGLWPGGTRKKFYGINPKKGWDDCARDYQAILRLYSEGKIKPVIGEVMPLAEAARAHELLEGGKTKGKIVLDCS